MKKIIFLLILNVLMFSNSTIGQNFGRAATDVYVMEIFTRPGEFGTIPLSGPYYPIDNVITGNAFTMLGGDFNAENTLYTFVYTDPNYVLGIVDLNTGAVNYAADVTGVVSSQQFLSQLSYNVTNNTYYALSHDPNNTNGSQLYSLNITTGVLTPIGGLDTIANCIAFEIDNNGIAYAADAITGNIYTISLTTGEVSLLGNGNPNGFYPVGQGFSLDNSTNTMYAVLQNSNGVIRSRFYTVNLTTGALTDLGDGSSRKYTLFAIKDQNLGVGDNIVDAFSIYPNPASTTIYVENVKGLEIRSVKLYDILGRNTNVKLIDNTINIENLSKGIYMLNIVTEDGSLTKKIIKE